MSDQLLGKGLPNMGNTCYIASIIQSLRYCKPFVYQNRNHDTAIDSALMRSFVELLYASATKSIYASLIHNLALKNPEFRLLRQCDAHELYLFLIDTFYTDNKAYDNLFRGTLSSCIECTSCSMQSITETPFVSLSLEMNTTIDSALDHFFSMETLDDKIDCERCKSKQVSTKQLSISSCPNIMVVHLKRFNGMVKNNTEIEFQQEMTVSGKKYALFAVCNHSGSTSGGHYTAACKKRNGTWIICNDNFITDLNKLPQQSAQPYVLFYQRI